MKTQFLTLLVGLLFTFSSGLAQKDYSFKVLANKGTNEIKSGDTWQPLKTGTSLKKEDEVKIGANAYVGLVSANGKPMELKTAGSYKVAELEGKVGTGSSVLNKYTDFILSSNSAEAKKNRLSATGAVHRDVDNNAIKLLLPENQHSGIFNTTAIINWDGSKAPGPYVVILRNMFDDELTKIETPETSIQIDLTDPKYVNENAILIEVTAKSDPNQKSKQHLIKKLPLNEQEQVKVSLGEIMGEVSDQTAFNKFILAGFYESHNLFIDAIAAYEEAIKLDPETTTYKEAYEEFLLRHGLKK
jgi:hypothetical protein